MLSSDWSVVAILTESHGRTNFFNIIQEGMRDHKGTSQSVGKISRTLNSDNDVLKDL